MALPGGAYDGSSVKITNAQVFIPEIWESEIRRFRDANFVMANTVKKAPMVGRKGDTMHIPYISRMSVYDKLPETPVTLQARTEAEYTLIIDKYKESSFMIEDVVNIQAAYNLRSEYTRESGYALAQDIDNFLLGLRADIASHNGGSQVIFNTSDGTATGTPLALNRASILASKQTLDEANVPLGGRKIAVSPGQYNDLLTIDEFISRDYIDGKPTANGVVGMLYGMEVTMSTNITANSLTGFSNGTGALAQPTPGVVGSPYLPTQIKNSSGALGTFLPVSANGLPVATAIMYHTDWALLAMQLNPKTESSREVLFQADAVVSTQIYGSATYRQDHVVLIHSSP